jgi:hypothetical protein
LDKYLPYINTILFLVLGYKYFLNVIRFKIIFPSLILTYVFFLGALNQFNFPSGLIKWSNEIIVGVFFIGVIIKRENKDQLINFPSLVPFLGLTLILILSLLHNNSDLLNSFFYYRFFLSPILFYWAIRNSSLSESQIRNINSFIVFLFFLQIPAQAVRAIIDLIEIGSFRESPVGTITTSGGGVASFIPLIAFGFLLSFYVIDKPKKQYWIFSILFMLVGIFSQKRAAFYFLPVIALLFAVIYLQTRRSSKLDFYNRFLKIALFLVPILIYIGARYNVMVTYENKLGGTISIERLIQHAEDYNSTQTDQGAAGRLSSFKAIWVKMLGDNFAVQLIGYGPSTVKGFNRGDGKMEQFGLLGAYPGWVFQYIQGGLLFCLFYIVLYYGILKKIYLILLTEFDSYWRSVEIGTILMISMLFIDFIIYGTTFLTVYAFSYTLGYLSAIIMKRKQIIIRDPRFSSVKLQ